MKLKLTVKCIGCGKKKVVGEEQREQPMCDECGMPMIPEKAEVK